jgi:hypothetical protein
MSEFEPPKSPRVDGIAAEWTPDVHIRDVMDLDRKCWPATVIAAHLKVDVLTIEHALKRVRTLKMLSGWRDR